MFQAAQYRQVEWSSDADTGPTSPSGKPERLAKVILHQRAVQHPQPRFDSAGDSEESMMLCDRCEHPLIEIDHYGERLKGCLQCNCWKGDKSAFIVELSVEDFEALRDLITRKRALP